MTNVRTYSGRVLVADDDPVNQKAMGMLLRRLGLQVDVVSDGTEVLRSLAAAGYDLVILDLNMPKMNGLEAAREIRRAEEAEGRSRVPLVALSGEQEERAREECRAAGMDDWLAKPFSLQKLLKVLENWLGAAGGGAHPGEEEAPGRRGAPAAAPEAPAGPVIPPTLDRERLEEIRALQSPQSPHFFREQVDLYLTTASGLMKRLRESLVARDEKELAEAAHQLMSGTLNMGGERLSGLCRDLEKLVRRGAIDSSDGLVGEIEAEFGRLREALAGERGEREGDDP